MKVLTAPEIQELPVYQRIMLMNTITAMAPQIRHEEISRVELDDEYRVTLVAVTYPTHAYPYAVTRLHRFGAEVEHDHVESSAEVVVG